MLFSFGGEEEGHLGPESEDFTLSFTNRDSPSFRLNVPIPGSNNINNRSITLPSPSPLVPIPLAGRLTDETLVLLCARAREEAGAHIFIADPLWLEIATKLPERLPADTSQATIIATMHHPEKGGHWTLLRLDARHGTIEHYDPARLSGLSEKVLDTVRGWIARLQSLPSHSFKTTVMVCSSPITDSLMSLDTYTVPNPTSECHLNTVFL